MDQIPAQALIGIGTILGAIIAGAFSYLNLVISKDQKVSEFRQAWIDALREDITQFISSVSFIANAYAMLDDEKDKPISWNDHIKSMESCFNIASRSYASIMLRVNPDDKNEELKRLNRELLATLSNIRQLLREEKYGNARELTDELEGKARPILKLEWERVKGGEPVFKITRYIAGTILVLAIVAGGLFFHKSFPDFEVNEKPMQSPSKMAPHSPALHSKDKSKKQPHPLNHS